MSRFVLALGTLVFSGTVLAQGMVIDETIDTFTKLLDGAQKALYPFVTKLFWSLVTLSFTWSFIQWALVKDELRSFVADLTRKILTVGFFAGCLQYSGGWTQAIIDSFKAWAGIAAGAGGPVKSMSPSFILDSAVSVISKVVSDGSTFNLAASILTGLVGIAIVVCFAIIAAVMVLTLVEAQFVALVNMILFAFGGAEWSMDYAKSSWRYTISVGLKVFIVYFLVGVGDGIMTDTLKAAESNNIEQLFGALGASFVLVILVKQIPDAIQSVVAGVTLTGSTNAAQTLGQVATGTAGAAMLLKEVTKHSAAAMNEGRNPLAAGAKAFAGAAMADVGDKLRGAPGSYGGTFGGRMASRVADSTSHLQTASIQPDRDSSAAARGLAQNADQPAGRKSNEGTSPGAIPSIQGALAQDKPLAGQDASSSYKKGETPSATTLPENFPEYEREPYISSVKDSSSKGQKNEQ